MTTLLGSVVASGWVGPGDTTNQPTAATATPLPDGTILLAWERPGGITVRHYTRNLGAVLDETTTTPESFPRGLALVTHGDGTPALLSGTRTWTVSVDPLTLAPGPGHTRAVLAEGTSHAVIGDAVVIAGNGEVVVHRVGQPIAQHPMPAEVLDVRPGTDGAALLTLAVYGETDDDWWKVYPQTHTFDQATGTLAHVATGPAIAASSGSVIAGPGPTWLAMRDEVNVDDQALVLYDDTGAVTADPGWPGSPESFLLGPMAAAPHPTDGTLAAAFARRNQNYTDPTAAAMTLAHIAADGLTLLELPLPAFGDLQSYSSARHPRLAVHGNTAVVAQVGYRLVPGTGAPEELAVLAWTVDLGDAPPPTHDAILAIDTVDLGRWWVGSRDPDMAYELVIDTATQRLVEIVAGEEHLATWELCVSDGFDWHVAALMRPDA